MRKSKKILALVTMLTMLLSMSSAVTVSAEEDLSNYVLCNDMEATSTFQNQKNNAVIKHTVKNDGIAGKEEGDTYALVADVNATQIYTQINIPWTDRMKKQYFTTSADFYVKQGVTDLELVFGTGQAFVVSLAGTAYEADKWNNVKFIYDAASTTGTFGYVTVYINDVYVKTFSDNANELKSTSTDTTNTSYRYQNFFKLRFKGSQMVFGIDNIKCVATDYAVILSENFNQKTAGETSLANGLRRVGNSTISYVNAVDGKANDDMSMLLTQKADTSIYPEFDVPVTAKYLKVKFNVKTDDNVTNEYLGTFQSQSSSNAWKKHHKANEWTSVELIIQNNNYDSVANTNFSSAVTVYINGSYVEYNGSNTLKKATNKKYFPMRLISSTSGNAKVYYDDITVIAYNEYMPAKPAAEPTASFTSNKVNVSVPVAKGTTRGTASMKFKTAKASDLLPTGKEVKVFTSKALTEEVTGDVTMNEGNVIMAVGNYGEIVYYDVVDNSITEDKVLLDINFDDQTLTGSTGNLTPNKPAANNEAYTGKFGKVAGKNDYSFGIANTNGNQDTFQIASATVSTTDVEYFTVSFNFYCDSDNFDKFYLGSQSGQRIGGPFTRSDLPLGKWNKVVLVYHNANPGTVAQNSNIALVCDAYINGVQVVTDKTVNAKTSTANTIPFRFGSDAMKINDQYTSCEVFYDDIVIKTCVYEPTVEEIADMTAVPEVSIAGEASKTIADVIYVVGDISIESIETDESNVVRVYADDTFATVINSGNLSNGNIIVVEGANKSLNYYTIKTAGFDVLNKTFTCDDKTANIAEVKEGTYKYIVSGMNKTTEARNVAPIIALYTEEGQLVDVGICENCQVNNVSADTWEFKVEAVLEVTGVEEGMYLKTFLWDMRTITPYE